MADGDRQTGDGGAQQRVPQRRQWEVLDWPDGGPACVRCAETLTPVFDGDDPSFGQYEGALSVTFSGGFGMYADPLVQPVLGQPVFLCRVCADRLCADQPWVAELLDADPAR